MQKFNPGFTNFEDIRVERPDKDEIINKINSLDEQLTSAENVEACIKTVRDYFDLSDDIRTIFSLIYIRHTINTADEYYSELSDLSDTISPEITDAMNTFEKHILTSEFVDGMKKEFGELYFKQLEQSSRTFSKEIIPDLVTENKLVSEYIKVTSGLIDFNGEKYSISQMGKFMNSLDRNVRKEASEKVWRFFAENDERIGKIYSDMVEVRTRIARKLGYENYVALGYERMGRLDWTSHDAKIYRKKILDYIVPLAKKITAAQKERLGFEDGMHYYDWAIFYKSGNPTPKGNPDELVNAAKKMYSEISPFASRYFNFMVDHHCMDLLAKPNKSGGGYMDYIPSLKTSFIFSNFNGTSGDVDVLTHEFGHSLQGFLGDEGTDVPAYRNPGMECCEMHSMSMEFLTYPWMNLFFKEDTQKYKYEHLADAITFLPYGCIVDAFQEYVYEHPEMSHSERKTYFRKLEKEYLPHKNYSGNDFLENGGYWMRQPHIFENPLYYLDYTIAQVVALEFFNESRKNYKDTFEKYLNFDRLAGNYSFRELLKKADIDNPMDGDTLKEVAESIDEYLGTFDLSTIDK